MGLWLDGLASGGEAPPGATEQEKLEAAARHLLLCLAMYVPRAWWEAGLTNPEALDKAWVPLVRTLRKQLLMVPELAALVSYPALVALPYTHDVGMSRQQADQIWRRYTLAEFVTATEPVLQAHPELRALG
jgi:hypothetical protein